MDVRSEMTAIMTSRENLYRLLCRIYKREIDESLLEQLQSMSFPEDGIENKLTTGYKLIHEFLCNTNDKTITDLAVDYAKVFLSAGASQGAAAFPYESVYTSRKKIIMQEAWDDVCAIYNKKGFTLGNVDSDFLEDHIACEFEFMALLCNETKKSTDVVTLLEEQEVFLKKHLINWIPRFCRDVEKYSDTMFYKAVALITTGFLKLEEKLIVDLKDSFVNKISSTASYRVTIEKMDQILESLNENYIIYAPKLFKRTGTKMNAEVVRYAEIMTVKEIVTDRQSDFSPKEAYYPVTQTMLYFTEKECIESKLEDDKDIIIFVRACDINAMNRLDNIFLLNGGHEDYYYKRMREKVKVVLLECENSFEDCFCVSLGANKTNNYNMAIRFGNEDILLEVKDKELATYFISEEEAEYSPSFVEFNNKKVELPKIENKEMLKQISNLDYWKEFNAKCIGCGACNTVCGSCSCFDTIDIIYHEGSKDGERRRIWSSCMLEDFTKTAGGNKARKTHGDDMRFKTLHKFYDYHARFGGDEHMCVGCGRCIRRCPQDISFFDTVTRLNDEIENINKCKNFAEEVC